jgi:phosphonatase-like hydrolase
MMNPFKLVVFDMAGTTVTDNGQVAQAFIDAFKTFNLDISADAAGRVMGFRKKEAISILLEEHPMREEAYSHQLVENIHDTFIRNMILFYETDPNLKPTPGAEELFGELRRHGIRVALNTGFIRAITDVILRRLGWDRHLHINAVISSDEVNHGRPQADMIHTLMDRLHIEDPALVVKVGDTLVDIEEGRQAGCGLVIGVTTGSCTRARLEASRPDAVIDRLDELLPLMALSNIPA